MRLALVVTRSDEPGGAQVYLRDLAAALSGRGWQVTVLAGGAGWLREELRALGIPSVALRRMARPLHPLRDAAALGELRAALRALRPDLVSLHSSKAGWLGRVAGWSLGVPTVFTAHGWPFAAGVPGRALYLAAEWLASLLPARVLAVCEADRALARRLLPLGDRLRCVPNGVPDRPGRADPAVQPPRMVMAGRFAPQKDHRTLLEACARLGPEPWTLDLPGDGPSREAAVGLAARLGLAGRVRLPGFRPDPGFEDAQVAVLASRWEGLPLTVLEAMRAGLPVVASRVGGLAEAVVDGETGFLVPPGDPEALSVALARLLRDPDLRVRMGRAGRLRYEGHFGHARMVEQTLAVYREALGRCD